jgi:hypothetical protein
VAEAESPFPRWQTPEHVLAGPATAALRETTRESDCLVSVPVDPSDTQKGIGFPSTWSTTSSREGLCPARSYACRSHLIARPNFVLPRNLAPRPGASLVVGAAMTKIRVTLRTRQPGRSSAEANLALLSDLPPGPLSPS